MSRFRSLLSVAFIVLFLCYVKPALAAVVVNSGPVNVRSEPNTSSKILLRASEGDSFDEIARQGEWYKVNLPGGGTGYIYSTLVHEEVAAAPNTIAVTGGTINVRTGPGESFPVKARIPANTVANVGAMSGKWAYVTFPGGQGWIASWLVDIKTLSAADFSAGTVARRVVGLRSSTAVRGGASEDYDVIASLKVGIQAEYLSSSDGWHRIRLANKTIGWVDASDVRVFNVDEGTGVQYEIGDNYWIMTVGRSGRATQQANVRKSGSTSAAIVGSLKKGQAFELLGSSNGWHNIRSGSLTGWVAGWLVSLDPLKGPASVRLDKKEYSKVLTISGDFPVTGFATLDDYNLGVMIAPKSGVRGRLDVFSGEMSSVEMGTSGLLLKFDERPAYRVLESKPGILRLEFYASVDSIAFGDGAKDSLDIVLGGYPDPQVVADDTRGTITIRFPGTQLAQAGSLVNRGVIQTAKTRVSGKDTFIDLQASAFCQYNLTRQRNLLTVTVLPRGLSGKVIVIDPGHGGSDPGAISRDRAVQEKKPNLAIALELKSLLEQRGARVVITRSSDAQGPDLASRVKAARDAGADLFISVHNNSSVKTDTAGTTIYYAESSLNSERSKRLSQITQRMLVQRLGTKDNGVKTAEFYVCKNAPVTAILAEVAFLSNSREAGLLQDQGFLSSAAAGIAQAVREFYGDM